MSILSIPEARNREHARLSNLFERLSARLPYSVYSEVISSSKNQTPPIPEDYSTVLRNLIRSSCGSERHPGTCGKTVAFTSSSSTSEVTSSQENDDERGFDEFRLAEEKKYPFTFKHMIHKLYKRDDWLRTVKEVLERSKKDFKPLAECAPKQNPELTDPKEVAHLRAAKRASDTVKKRELWRANLTGVNEPPAGGESLRALKKRCVGIRKSMSGRPSGDGNQDVSNATKEPERGATFVFASTISSTERPGKEIYLHFPSPEVSPSNSCFSDAGQDPTLPHSPISPITPTPIPVYTTTCASGVKRKVGVNLGVLVLNAVPRRLKERNLDRLSPESFPQGD